MLNLIDFLTDKEKRTIQTSIQNERIDETENAFYISFPITQRLKRVSFSRISLEDEFENVLQIVKKQDVFIRCFSDSVVLKIIKRGVVNVRVENLIFEFENCKIRINGLYRKKPSNG